MENILWTTDSQLLETLVMKHFTQKKTREELTKFVIRKCFKFLKKKMDDGTSSPIEVEKKFKDTYLDGKADLMPFRKCSRTKTMNNEFILFLF